MRVSNSQSILKEKKKKTYGLLDRLGRSRSGFLKECVDSDSHGLFCVECGVDEKRVRYMKIIRDERFWETFHPSPNFYLGEDTKFFGDFLLFEWWLCNRAHAFVIFYFFAARRVSGLPTTVRDVDRAQSKKGTPKKREKSKEIALRLSLSSLLCLLWGKKKARGRDERRKEKKERKKRKKEKKRVCLSVFLFNQKC